MTDHFARMGVPRAAWLDLDALKKIFLARSSELHPDKAANKTAAEEQFRALNESYQILRNTRGRLLHLLELHGFSKPEHVQSIPTIAADLFSQIAELTRASEALQKQKALANSPMLKVKWFETALPCLDRIQALQNDVQQRIGLIETDLSQLPAGADVNALSVKLAETAAALGFLERWRTQLQERAANLTF